MPIAVFNVFDFAPEEDFGITYIISYVCKTSKSGLHSMIYSPDNLNVVPNSSCAAEHYVSAFD